MKRITLLAVALATIMAATAADAKKINWNDARKIQTGMTTEEVTAIMGKPTAVNSHDGVIRYAWVHVGMWSATTQTLAIDFKDGKVVEAPVIPAEFK